MTKIIFLTSGAIKYQLPGYSLFESVCLTARGKIFPPLEPGAEFEIVKVVKDLQDKKIDLIITAPTTQARETANLLGKFLNKTVQEDRDLSPLRFDPRKMITESEFERLGDKVFDVLRVKFLDHFFANNLIDSNKKVEVRFANLEKRYCGKVILAVSHAFLIKLFSVYNGIGGEMFTNRKRLFTLFDPSKVPFGRLSGTEIDI